MGQFAFARARASSFILASSALVACAKAPPPAAEPAPSGAEATASEPSHAEPRERPAAAQDGSSSAPPDVATPPAHAGRSASGVAWVVLHHGAGGDAAGPDARVLVHYTGWTREGEMFDSSRQRSGPMMLPLDRTVPGFREGVAAMTKGEKRRIWIPAELAYGDAPQQEGAPSGQLTFDVELFDILIPPATPEDVAAPSAGATVTPSGLAYRVLRAGTSTDHPTDGSRITVHYSAWTKDGRLFDSSVQRGQPFSFTTSQVIPGWAEGIQLMTVGSVYRFWIPAELAYGDKPRYSSMPAGQLTFDVELIGFE